MLINLLLGILHCVIHEIGHVIAAWMVGSKVKKVGIKWCGFYVRRTNTTPVRNVFVALAGPTVNLLTWGVLAGSHSPHAWIAGLIGGFNLLPVPGSDLMRAVHYIQRGKELLRTRIEREDELQALRELEGRVPEAGDDGEDNRERIGAQINVIDSVLTREQIREMYEHDEGVLTAALDAESWLRQDDDPPSTKWAEEMEVAA